MKLRSSIAALLLIFFSAMCQAQHVQLYWYVLQSVEPIDEAEAKEVLTLIRNNTNDSLTSFTDKTDTFKLATHTEVQMDDLAGILNDAGFYIADITDGKEHHSNYVKSSYSYQLIILYMLNAEAFNEVYTEPFGITPQIIASLPAPLQGRMGEMEGKVFTK